MSDLMYMDYYNGMSDVANVNTVRLYKNGVKHKTARWICSAPYNESLNYTITNNFENNAAGFALQLLEKAAKGRQDAQKLFGEAGQFTSQIMTALNINKNADIEKLAGAINTEANKALGEGAKEVVMPWNETKIYTRTDLDNPIPSLNLCLLSSTDLAYTLLKHTIAKNDLTDDKIINTKPRELKKDGTKQAYLSLKKDLNINLKMGDIEMDVDKPVLTYIRYLVDELGGKVYSSRSKSTDKLTAFMKKSMDFKSPIEYNPNEKLKNVLDFSDKGNEYQLDTVDDGTCWLSIGDPSRPIIIYNLLPHTLKITPSKQLTTNGDFLYATISIDFMRSKKLESTRFDAMIKPTTLE